MHIQLEPEKETTLEQGCTEGDTWGGGVQYRPPRLADDIRKIAHLLGNKKIGKYVNRMNEKKPSMIIR